MHWREPYVLSQPFTAAKDSENIPKGSICETDGVAATTAPHMSSASSKPEPHAMAVRSQHMKSNRYKILSMDAITAAQCSSRSHPKV